MNDTQAGPDLAAVIAARRAALQKQPPQDDLGKTIAARREALSAPNPSATAGQQFAALVGQGASLGFGKKILGGIDAANKMLPKSWGGESAPLSDFGKNYAATRDRIGGLEDQGIHDHPVAGRAVELAAGALPMMVGGAIEGAYGAGTAALKAGAKVVRPLATRMADAASVGGLFGAASGAGHATGGIDDYAKEVGTGAIIGGAIGAAIPAGGAGSKWAGSKIMDIAGRPEQSRPVFTLAGRPVGRIEGIDDRAATLTRKGLGDAPLTVPPGDKPLAVADIGGIPAQRQLRGLKTAYPAAEVVARDALEPRGAGAVERVINHGLETTGLVSRESGILTEKHLHDLAQTQGNESYGKTFANSPNPITNPEHLQRLNDIANTPAGQIAIKAGERIARNRRDPIGTIDAGGGVPDGYTPEQWADITHTMQERGMPVPNVASGTKQLAPTLKQAHYIKLGFDDLLNGAPEPGSGGSGPHNAAAIRQLKNDWLAVMDEHSPEYGASRKQYADTKQLEDAAALGQKLFRMHPDQFKVELADMPADAQKVARRTGFNALAERVENGPADVDKGLKNIDRQRMRLLFPEDGNGFAQFQEGLKQEAQMHATKQGALSGSNSMDKMADMANMAGVTSPEVLQAVTGRFGPAIRGVAGRALGEKIRGNMERLAAERARLLTAGANGDAGARAEALRRLIAPTDPSAP